MLTIIVINFILTNSHADTHCMLVAPVFRYCEAMFNLLALSTRSRQYFILARMHNFVNWYLYNIKYSVIDKQHTAPNPIQVNYIQMSSRIPSSPSAETHHTVEPCIEVLDEATDASISVSITSTLGIPTSFMSTFSFSFTLILHPIRASSTGSFPNSS